MKKKGWKSSMQNDADGPPLEKNTTLPTESVQEKPICLFTQEEIKNIVKDFINAWLRGDVDFRFADANELIERSRITGKKISYDEAMTQERVDKTRFINVISICSDESIGTPEEKQKALQDAFKGIISLRIGHRLDGKFTGNKAEEKIARLGEDTKELNKHFEELYFYVKTKIPDDSVLGKR
jgi:hypothetical protein